MFIILMCYSLKLFTNIHVPGLVNASGVVPDGALGSRNVEMPKHYEICGKVSSAVIYPPNALGTADQR